MENSYSITVTNKFSLALDEDEDPLELLKVREQEKEAKKKEKLSEKENKSKQPEPTKPAGVKPPKPRVIKDNQEHQKVQKPQENKKEQVEKKPSQPRSSGNDRNVKFSGESREEYNNRRNREDGDRPPRGHGGDMRRGPPSGEGRDNREFRNRESGDGPRGEFGDRRGPRSGGPRGAGSGGPRGGSRGGPRGARSGFDSRGKREFDRQSGSDKTQTRHNYSGVKPVDKKDGAGSHNWGTHNDEIEESLNNDHQDWNTDKPDAENPNISSELKDGETPAADASAEEKPAEEEAKELTFDEWKALRGARAKPTYNLRKAGEGEDLTRWKKMYALEKKKEGAEEEDEEEEDYDAAVEYPQRVGRQKRVYDIEIQFTDSRRGGSGRGGRGGRGQRGDRQNGRGFGGNRGGPPREGGPAAEPRAPVVSVSVEPPAAAIKVAGPVVEQRSPRGRQNAPKVDDEHDFPSLG
ncbi:plasminogen activator inhibitor 1 RNA-binding protein isoform X2 [Diachasma alloeum]|uniref:plasminogen activator inhibitor 1 RNA-binding protein isoform X2 n=1 Tax=Diachasma alloeum TaxID=454923 RepID=UPI0007383D7F|nr:plasminogen activator inhibitor 1 RNA-binding protein isoform X2 [Diachasma alloeum]